MFAQGPVFALPLLSHRLWNKVADLTGNRYSEFLVPWTVKLNSMELTERQREALQDLLAFLFQQLRASGGQGSTLIRSFQAYMIDNHQVLEPLHVLAALAYFEETVCELLRRKLDKADANPACAWIRSLVLNLQYTTFEATCLPVCPSRENNKEWSSPLVRMLNRTALRERWQWVALFTSAPQIRILELAVRDEEGTGWKAAAVRLDLTRQALAGLQGNDPQICRQTVIPGIGLAAAGAADPPGRHRLAQIARWLQAAFELSAHLGAPPSQSSNLLRRYEAVLQFDEALLQSRDLQDIFSATVENACRIGGFRRSALFWYTPLTRTIQGVHSYNVPREDIQSIREPVENLSGIQEVFEKRKPVHFERIHQRLPDHYVESFHLSSLLVCPIPGTAETPPMAVLLIDQDGVPFQADEGTLTVLEAMMSRVSKTVSARLLNPVTKASLPSSGVLTPREQQILQFIAEGLDTKEISQQLHLSEYTVSEYVGTILRKLRASNRAEAVAKAIRQNIIQ